MRPPGKDRRDTNRIGDISESAITTRLLYLGYTVLIPYGGNKRYDLMIEDDDGQIWRIQCKTARVSESGTTLIFSTSIRNVTGKHRQPRHYRGQCDYFAAYCEKLNSVYLVPVDQVGIVGANLRLTPTKNHQAKNVRWAKDYEL